MVISLFDFDRGTYYLVEKKRALSDWSMARP